MKVYFMKNADQLFLHFTWDEDESSRKRIEWHVRTHLVHLSPFRAEAMVHKVTGI